MALAPRLATGVAVWRPRAAVVDSVSAWVAGSLDEIDPTTRPVFVAEREGRILGFVTATTKKHWTGEVDAYVGELVVAADVASSGVGRALMSAVEMWATRSGHRRLTLETGAANHDARAFYAALGYEEEEVTLSQALER